MTTLGFLESPLVIWVQTFSAEQISYPDLTNGIFLNEVFQQIDSKCSLEGILYRAEDVREKIQNWEILLKNIKIYYQDVLQQHVIMKPPDIFVICTHPDSESAQSQINVTLLMILGCAIQCEQKELHIEVIKGLDLGVQHSIMQSIQQITDSSRNVLNVDFSVNELDETSLILYSHLITLINQRDSYLQEIKSLHQTLNDFDIDESWVNSMVSMGNKLTPEFGSRVSSMGLSISSAVDLAECKAKLRRLRQDLEDKNDTISELEDEIETFKQNIQKLKNENQDLVQESRNTKAYRDELDIVKEKANRVDKLESEIQRYKEKLLEFDFYKDRVEELRQDNSVLFENRRLLEEQVEACHQRIQAVVELESDLKKYKQRMEKISAERDSDREQIQYLIELNAKLEFEKKMSSGTDSNLEDELQHSRDMACKNLSTSLSEQLLQATHSQVLCLELENQRLRKDLEEIRENVLLENASRVMELEKENTRLAQKVDKYVETSAKDEKKYSEVEIKYQEATREKKNLEQTIETVKENAERQVKELVKENDQLSNIVQSLRERSEKTNDLRVKDLENDNKKLNETVKNLTSQISSLEQDSRQLNKKCLQLSDDESRVKSLEEKLCRFEEENEDLKKNVVTLKRLCEQNENLEREYNQLESERKKLSKTIESLQKTNANKEVLEKENINLTVEVLNLKRGLESAKTASSKLAEVEQEKDELNRQVQQLKKSLELSKVEKEKSEQLESEKFGLNAEKQQLQRNLEAVNSRLKTFERDFDDLESQNGELRKKIEQMKLSCRQMEEMKKRLEELESENVQLVKEKTGFEKENKKLKQSLKEKEAVVDEVTFRVSEMEKENKNLKKLADRSKDMEARLLEAEKENLELVQSSGVEKKTLTSLKQELVNEKIKCQRLQDDLEAAKKEVESVEREKKQSNRASYCGYDSKSSFDEFVKSQDEQIRSLNQRLDESKMTIARLQAELNSSHRKDDVTICKDRTLMVTQRYSHSPSATQEILNLKDQIIKLERCNATLEEENKNIKQQTATLQDHLAQLQNQNSQWQSQIFSFQTQCNSMHSQIAKIQVENATLQSQNGSLSSQNTTLQSQLTKLESAVDRLKQEQEETLSINKTLEKNCRALQNLHHDLTSEHESLVTEHSALKTSYRTMRTDFKMAQDRNLALMREKETVAHLKRTLLHDKESLKSESQSMNAIQSDYLHVKEDNLRLLNANDKLNGSYQELLSDHKRTKNELNQLRGQLDDLQTRFNSCRRHLTERDSDLAKVLLRYDASNQMTIKLEEENSALMMQLQALIGQNQDLLTKLLNSKDQIVEEQKSYVERLADLKRQKERLEEKIVDQNKEMKKSKSFATSFMKKAQQMIKGLGGKDSSRSQGEVGESSFLTDSGENSSYGSGSVVAKPQENFLMTMDRNNLTPLDGESVSSGNETRCVDGSQRALLRKQLKNSGQQTYKAPIRNSGIGTDDDLMTQGRDEDSEHITLNQFLDECNQSPKSRRKLLIEKRVALDDIPCKAENGLNPRPPIIIDKSLHRGFKSELNVSSPEQSQDSKPRRTNTLGRKLDPSRKIMDERFAFNAQSAVAGSSRNWAMDSPGNVESVKPNPRQTGLQRASSAVGSHPRAENRFESYPRGLPRQMSSDGVLDRDGNNCSGFEHSANASQKLGNSSQPYRHAVTSANVAYVGPSSHTSQPCDINKSRSPSVPADKLQSMAEQAAAHYQPYKSNYPSSPQYDVVSPECNRFSNVNDRNSMLTYVEYHYTQSDIPAVHVDDHSSMSPNDGEMGSQYTPRNVRNLVQSFQLAVNPNGNNGQASNNTQSSSQLSVKGRIMRPMSAGPGNGANSSCRSEKADDYYYQALSNTPRSKDFQKRSSDRDPDRSEHSNVKSNVNVCMVRPATGRALPKPPSNESQISGDCTFGPGITSTPRSSGVPEQHAQSNSDGKLGQYQDYGCL